MDQGVTIPQACIVEDDTALCLALLLLLFIPPGGGQCVLALLNHFSFLRVPDSAQSCDHLLNINYRDLVAGHESGEGLPPG